MHRGDVVVTRDLILSFKKIWPHWLGLGTVAILDWRVHTIWGLFGFSVCLFSMGFLYWMAYKRLLLDRRFQSEHAGLMEMLRRRLDQF